MGHVSVDDNRNKTRGRKWFRTDGPEALPRDRIVVLGGQETEKGADALAILWVVKIVAPAVEVSVLVSVVTRAVVLLFVALQLSAQRYIVHHTGDIDVSQPVCKLVHIDVVVGDGVVHHGLPLYPRLPSPERAKVRIIIIAIVSNGQKDWQEIKGWNRMLTPEESPGIPWRCTQGEERCWRGEAPLCWVEKRQKQFPEPTLGLPPCLQ